MTKPLLFEWQNDTKELEIEAYKASLSMLVCRTIAYSLMTKAKKFHEGHRNFNMRVTKEDGVVLCIFTPCPNVDPFLQMAAEKNKPWDYGKSVRPGFIGF